MQSSQTPEAPPAPQTDARGDLVRQAEIIISHVLRGGVLLSAAIIALGSLLFYLRYLSGHETTAAWQQVPHTPAAVVGGVFAGNPLAVIALGLLLLLLTPVIRVAVSIVAFALEHDWLYVGITALVLTILIVSFLLGRGGG